MSQTEMILNHLRECGSISPKEAMDDYGIMRLGARIYDLKRQGHTILRVPETKANLFGKLTTYARYVMVPEPAGGTA